MRVHTLVLVALALLLAASLVHAVEKSKFRNCDRSPFCVRNRKYADGDLPSPYVLRAESASLSEDGTSFTVDIINRNNEVSYALQARAYPSGIMRVQVRESSPSRVRYEVQDVLLDSLSPVPFDPETNMGVLHAGAATLVFKGVGETDEDSFSLEYYVNNEKMVVVNSRNLFSFEHTGATADAPKRESNNDKNDDDNDDNNNDKNDDNDDNNNDDDDNNDDDNNNDDNDDNNDDDVDGDDEQAVVDTEVEEVDPPRFRAVDSSNVDDSWGQDSVPHGATSISTDFAFINSRHLYGIPEHATSMLLKTTRGKHAAYKDPYRLYNLDVFEYDLDVEMALYGHVPLLISQHQKGGKGGPAWTTALFWLNAAETFVDIGDESEGDEETDIHTHWFSESGIVDFFLLPGGASPLDVLEQYALLTGTTPLPPLFATAYHQCRWNYKDEADVANVDANFDVHDIPYDVLWLDIEHTDGKRYFTWDHHTFPTPKEMQGKLAAKGRKMVTIVDPHIKKDDGFAAYSSALSEDVYVKDKDNKDYSGWCWPGESRWVDFTMAKGREWWSNMFSYANYEGSTSTLFTWNDMNEPSVFNGPEITMRKDAIHRGRDGDEHIEHRDVHNLYGMYQHSSTYNGLVERNDPPNLRPFVLSRAFFAGSQRYGAVWTGDNLAEWGHLEYQQPMLLTLGLTGIAFSGADVGGFFKDPEPELLVRWYQANSFVPFFRAHGHIDTQRREPWLFGEENTDLIRTAIRLRYALLPYVYTLFRENEQHGSPLMRPLWLHYPRDTHTFGMDHQFLLGSDILVHPVVKQGTRDVEVYMPMDKWYDFYDPSFTVQGPNVVQASTPMDRVVAFQRGGSIIPTKQRARRSSTQMVNDPYTLLVALDVEGTAKGELYVDDGSTFDYQSSSQYSHRVFTFEDDTLTSSPHASDTDHTYVPTNTIERVVLMGLDSEPIKAVLTGGGELDVIWDAERKVATLRKPNVVACEEWSVVFTLKSLSWAERV